MIPSSVYEKALHSKAVISLYRELLRDANKLKNVKVNDEIQKQLGSDHNEAYFKNLSFELKSFINEEFRNPRRNTSALGNQIVKGVQFITCLHDFIIDNQQFEPLLTFTNDYKSDLDKKQERRAELLIKKANGEIKETNNKYHMKKPTDPVTIFYKLSTKERSKVLKEEIEKSKFQSNHLLRRYFALQQSQFKIPLPQKLPYTSQLPKAKASELGNASYGSKRSENASDIYKSYDQDYVDAIVIPSLEYDINKFHFFEQFSWKINERGPAKVKIRVTNAGAYGMAYLDLPFRNNKDLTKLANDIKNSIKLNRVKSVWDSPDGRINEERLQRDGSYGIKGSRGFGPEETFHPRFHHEELAISEGEWEFLVYLESLGDKIAESDFNELIKLRDSSIKLWTDDLNVVSKLLESEYQNQKSEKMRIRSTESKVDNERSDYQKQMNLHFEKMTESYLQLLAKLKNNQIHKHSELVNLGDRVSNSYRNKLDHETKAKKVINGIPSIERIGLAKKLPEYLVEAKYTNFMWGQKFYDRFKF
ncbi:hypothetical protein DFJ63DRAFT_316007 [Scheffersomyces coipomensis]|uniref:uncharacterized protein n=1 Tax=Scheffersomyces coipomensis TaxID=1788519 RepID=UPI00315CAA91